MVAVAPHPARDKCNCVGQLVSVRKARRGLTVNSPRAVFLVQSPFISLTWDPERRGAQHSSHDTLPSVPSRSDEIGGEIEVAPAGPVQPHTAATLLRIPCSLAGATSTEVCGTTIAPRLPRNVALKDTLTHTTVRRHLCRAPKSAATEAAGCHQ